MCMINSYRDGPKEQAVKDLTRVKENLEYRLDEVKSQLSAFQ